MMLCDTNEDFSKYIRFFTAVFQNSGHKTKCLDNFLEISNKCTHNYTYSILNKIEIQTAAISMLKYLKNILFAILQS